jgi:uncharacterized protein (DUF58 family)
MAAKRGITITRQGIYYLAVLGFLFAGAILRDINLLMVLFGLMLGPLLYNWQVARYGLSRIEVSRTLPKRIVAGDRLEIEIQATNRGRRCGWALILEDRLRLESSGEPVAPVKPEVYVPRLPRRSTRRTVYHGRLYQRGRYTLGPLSITTRFPFGLIQHRVVQDVQDRLLVLPAVGRLTPQWSQVVQDLAGTGQQARRRQGVVEGDYHGLRKWRSGDSRRWIHWRTSARQGELMVRQFEQHRNQDLLLIVDLACDDPKSLAQREAVELAVSFAATVVATLCRQGGGRLVVGVAGRKSIISSGTSSRALMEDVMETLAVAEATPEDCLAETIDACLETIPRSTRAILISTRGVDLKDTQRFATPWDDPRKRAWLSRALCIDASSDALDAYFQPFAMEPIS